MTRKQAIEEIIDTFTDEYADEIIQALEQEPCEDCISRAEAINAINGFSACETVLNLKELPSVQPTRIHSRWINPECQADGMFTITCEYCGAIVNTNFYSGNIDYCPNCGADMREVDE